MKFNADEIALKFVEANRGRVRYADSIRNPNDPDMWWQVKDSHHWKDVGATTIFTMARNMIREEAKEYVLPRNIDAVMKFIKIDLTV